MGLKKKKKNDQEGVAEFRTKLQKLLLRVLRFVTEC